MATRRELIKECASMIHMYERDKQRAQAIATQGSEERTVIETKIDKAKREIARLTAAVEELEFQLDPANVKSIIAECDEKIVRLKRRIKRIQIQPKVRQLEKEDKQLTRALKRLKALGLDPSVVHEQLAATLATIEAKKQGGK